MIGAGMAEAIEWTVAQLEAAGLAATADHRNLNPPAVWVVGRFSEPDTLAGTAEVAIDLFPIAPAADDMAAYVALDGMAQAITDAGFRLTDADVIETRAIQIPGGGTPMPAYRFPTFVRVTT